MAYLPDRAGGGILAAGISASHTVANHKRGKGEHAACAEKSVIIIISTSISSLALETTGRRRMPGGSYPPTRQAETVHHWSEMSAVGRH